MVVRRDAGKRKNAMGLIFGTFLLTVSCHEKIHQNLPNALSGRTLIEEVSILGNRRASTDTIRSNIQAKVGDEFSPAVIKRDIQRLYSLGYFDDVRVEETTGANGGKIVTFVLREKL